MIWNTAKLGDVCFVRRGTTITKKNAVEGDVPVIGGGTKPTYFHNEPNREAGCITISGSGASAGFVNRWDMPIFASDCSTVEPKDEMQLPKFVYYYLLSQQQFIYNNFRSGAAQPHVYAKDIETLDFPILPLAEQERIVAKLDAAFAEIDEAVEFLLNKLISCGSLLVKSISEEFAVPKAEHNIKFADVCELKRGYDLPKRQRKSGNFPLFSANGITDYIHESKVVAPGVVTGRSGTIGAVHYTDEDFWPLNTALYVRDFKGNLPRYIFYFLKSFNLKSFSSGAGVPTLNRNVLSAELVNINRKKEEQRRTINKLDSVINKIEELKITFKEQENNYIALKSAILAQELQSSEAA